MKKETPVEVSFEAFNIVNKSEEGVKMPLHLPNGQETTSWLKLRGANSPTFEVAVGQADREQLELVGKEDKMSTEEYNGARREITRRMLSVLVVDWSFDKPCTHEKVVEFFKGAPQIQRSVDTFATQDRHFVDDSFIKPPTN